MKINLLRHVAVTLGIGVCGFSSLQTAVAQQYGQPNGGYPPPQSLNQGGHGQQSHGQPANAQQQYAQPQFALPNQNQPSYAQPQAGTTLLPPTPTPQYRPSAVTQPATNRVAGPTLYDAASTAPSQPPANQRWNSFNNPSVNLTQPGPQAATQRPSFQVVSDDKSMSLPSPEPVPAPDAYSYSPQQAPVQNYAPGQSYTPVQSHATHHHAPGADCQSCNQGGSPYMQAASAPWGADDYRMIGGGDCNTGSCGVPARPEIYPWFGSFNLLFLNVENGSNTILGIGGGLPSVWSSGVAPESALGFDVGFGRYLGCGKYGLGVNYFHFDPDSEERIYTFAAGDARPAMQGYHDYHLDNGGADNQVYDYITGASTATAGATNIRARRDLDINGLELNVFSFGLMGAQRAAPLCGDGVGHVGGGGMRQKMAAFFGSGGRAHAGYGYGGAAGPLVRPCSGRVQVMTSHGFRWLRIKDKVELAYNIDGGAGYQATDIYDNVCVENNLLGYQFGGRLTYCLSNRLNFNVGGKFGVYGNHAEAERRVGTLNETAYRFNDPADLAETEVSDTVLSTLGELDLGLGFRVSNAWTVNGGYRVFGVSGIATGFDQMAQDFGTSVYPGSVYANDSLLLHGAYVGAAYNW